MPEYDITTPLNSADVARIKSGDRVKISGKIYTARDAAHKRLIELLNRGEKLPLELQGQIIYYAGPAPAKPGYVIGPAGPTTSGRMDQYTTPLLQAGLKGMIGKGARSEEVKAGLVTYGAVYFAAVGGAAALISRKIKKAEIIAFHDLGPEAIYELEVEEFPVIAVNDMYGNDLYLEGMKKFLRVEEEVNRNVVTG